MTLDRFGHGNRGGQKNIHLIPIEAERYVFNIQDNSYRPIIGVECAKEFISTKFVNSYAEYDKEDAATVSKF